MRKTIAVTLLITSAVVSATTGWVMGKKSSNQKLLNPIQTPIPKPLEIYSIENLSRTKVPKNNITLKNILKENKDYSIYTFEHIFDPTLSNKSTKKVTGLINIPRKEGPFPLVIMIRGYVDQEIYKTGMGTKKAGEFFASHGFITLAPDFLGYAGSDPESENIFETRFQTYTTTLSLLSSLQSIESWDKRNLFIWAHSNGGQIALTVLIITKQSIPTTLWAPVTKPFPYNILYYTDESEDGGKLIRKELSKFEGLYNIDKYSFTNYLHKLNSPLQIHQGTADSAVPHKWNEEFVKKLNILNLNPNFYSYPNANHNLVPGWDLAITRDLDFFLENMQK